MINILFLLKKKSFSYWNKYWRFIHSREIIFITNKSASHTNSLWLGQSERDIDGVYICVLGFKMCLWRHSENRWNWGVSYNTWWIWYNSFCAIFIL